MTDKAIIGGVAIVGVIGGLGAYALTRKPPTVTPPSNETAILSVSPTGTITLDSSGTATVDMEISVTQNGSPVPNATTFLFEGTTQQGSSEVTDANGNAKYTFTFDKEGSFTFMGQVTV